MRRLDKEGWRRYGCGAKAVRVHTTIGQLQSSLGQIPALIGETVYIDKERYDELDGARIPYPTVRLENDDREHSYPAIEFIKGSDCSWKKEVRVATYLEDKVNDGHGVLFDINNPIFLINGIELHPEAKVNEMMAIL